jgi:hypothetical protein
MPSGKYLTPPLDGGGARTLRAADYFFAAIGRILMLRNDTLP